MKNNLLFFFFFLCINTFGQDTSYKIVCTYRLDFQPDSTDIASKKSEDMLLMIGEKRSVFESKNSHLLDSAEKFISDLNAYLRYAATIRTAFRYVVIKDISNDLIYQDYIDIKKYEYKEVKNKFHWQIAQDTATINGFKCQKATTHFGGREWSAWFASEVTISDGPYKFCGLPGLIIKIYDSQEYYSFILRELRIRQGIIYANNSKVQIVDKEIFYKSLNYFKQNQFELIQARGVKITAGAESIKQRIEERNRKNNNPIELSKVQN